MGRSFRSHLRNGSRVQGWMLRVRQGQGLPPRHLLPPERRGASPMSGFAAADSATTQSLGTAISAEDIRNSGIKAPDDVAQYAAMLGDDALILAQRLGWWISRAPEM